jgi:DNA-binding IclR family transcriptional regulator
MPDLTSALRPLAILELLSSRPDGITLRELRDELGIPRSSAWLLVRQLEDGGFISKADTHTFVAGARLIQMGLSLYQTASMGGDTRIFLQELSATTGLDVYLAIRTGDSVVYADRVFGEKSVQVRRTLGEPRPLHASVAGKLFLAYDTDGLWDRCIADKELKRYTPATVTDPAALRAQLDEVTRRGYVAAYSEVLSSISSLGCMAFNPDGSPWAAVVISAHESDLDPKEDEVIKQLVETAAQLTKARGDLTAR